MHGNNNSASCAVQNKTVSPKNFYEFFRCQGRNGIHIAALSVMLYSSVFDSSGIGSPWATRLSIYIAIASLAIEIASSIVSP